LEYPSQSCSAPVSLLWSVDLAGTCEIFNATDSSWQTLKNFQFDIARINGPDTSILDNITTNSAGAFSSTIPSGNYEIYYLLNTNQPQLFPVRGMQSPFDFFYGCYNTRARAVAPTIQHVAKLQDTTTLGDPSLFFALRIMRDMTMTDSILDPYSPFDLVDLNQGVNVYMDPLDTVWSGYGVSGTEPVILMSQSDAIMQIACHELGHHAMFVLQGTHELPSPFDSASHFSDMFSDSVFAFKEGWADFIHCISMSPSEALVHRGQNIEVNTYWRGLPPAYPGDTVDCGEIIEGSVASMLYDLYDSPDRPGSRTLPEDDSVALDSMMQYILDCIWMHNSPEANQTRTILKLAERLVQDESARWFGDSAFQDARQYICDVFAAHHFIVPLDFCQGSGALDGGEQCYDSDKGIEDRPPFQFNCTGTPVLASPIRACSQPGDSRDRRTKLDYQMR
jgi:hypothetical protein